MPIIGTINQVRDNVEVSILDTTYILDAFIFIGLLEEWMEYKTEEKKNYL
jgi:hypothetical protein